MRAIKRVEDTNTAEMEKITGGLAIPGLFSIPVGFYMAAYIESPRTLADQFMKLNGVGRKSSQRMAFSVLDMSGEEAAAFAQAILDAKSQDPPLPRLPNLTDRELCPVCADETRDRSVICVVADCRTVLAIEKVREYQEPITFCTAFCRRSTVSRRIC